MMTPLYHLNNIIIVFSLIFMLGIAKNYQKSKNFKDFISSLVEERIFYSVFEQTSKIFSVFTIGYILIIYMHAMYGTLHLQKQAIRINESVISTVEDFNLDKIGLPDWKMPDKNLSGLSDEQNSIVEHQIAAAFEKKLLICTYKNQDKTVRLFWYDPAVLNEIKQPDGNFYRKYWENHPLQQIEGRTGTCPNAIKQSYRQ